MNSVLDVLKTLTSGHITGKKCQADSA